MSDDGNDALGEFLFVNLPGVSEEDLARLWAGLLRIIQEELNRHHSAFHVVYCRDMAEIRQWERETWFDRLLKASSS